MARQQCVSMLAIFLLLTIRGTRADNGDDPVIPDEARLYKFLVDRYDQISPHRQVIPVLNVSQTQKLKFGVTLISIVDADPAAWTVTLNVWERYSWTDAFLTWDPAEFGGLDSLRMAESDVWLPDVVLYNAAEPEPARAEVRVVVTSDGGVLYIPRVQHRVSCQAVQADAPGAMWSCDMKFGSWVFDGFRMDLDFYNDEAGINIDDFIENPAYAILEHDARKDTKYYPCCAEPYPSLTFKLKLYVSGLASSAVAVMHFGHLVLVVLAAFTLTL